MNLYSDWLPVKRFHIRSKNTLSKTNFIMAAVVQDRESEFVSGLDASLEGFVHRTLKEQQRECIRRIVCEKKKMFSLCFPRDSAKDKARKTKKANKAYK